METELTAKDLMVGDLVNIYVFTKDTPQEKDLFPARVTCILSDGGNNDFDTIECVTPKDGHIASRPADTCLPIPLTAEVLEKNNFEKHYDDDIIIYTHPQGIIIEMGINYKLFDDGHFYVSGIKHRLYYVHELQHALRLCGVDKEIVL